jgi:hypothetical protein
MTGRSICVLSVITALTLGSITLMLGAPSRHHQKKTFRRPQPPPAPSQPAPKMGFDANLLPGRYYFGDGLGVNCLLTLDADHRFKFSWHGCLGEYDKNSGSWEIENDLVVMKPEQPNKREGFVGMNVRFVPVKWGERIYLVDENETPGFCAATAKRSDLRLDDIHGMDYVKWDGENLPPLKGNPILPERYREFYEKGPVVAKVTKIEPDGSVILNKGSAGKVKEGMLLCVNAFDNSEIKVTSVRKDTATANVLYFWNSDTKIKVGDEFTTGGYYHRPHGTGYERFLQPPVKPKKANSH